MSDLQFLGRLERAFTLPRSAAPSAWPPSLPGGRGDERRGCSTSPLGRLEYVPLGRPNVQSSMWKMRVRFQRARADSFATSHQMSSLWGTKRNPNSPRELTIFILVVGVVAVWTLMEEWWQRRRRGRR